MLLRTELGLLLDQLDVPEQRRTDLGWLARNLAIRNSENPAFPRAIEIVKKLHKEFHGADGSLALDEEMNLRSMEGDQGAADWVYLNLK